MQIFEVILETCIYCSMYVMPSYKKPLCRCFFSLAAIRHVWGMKQDWAVKTHKLQWWWQNWRILLLTLSFLCALQLNTVSGFEKLQSKCFLTVFVCKWGQKLLKLSDFGVSVSYRVGAITGDTADFLSYCRHMWHISKQHKKGNKYAT